MPGAIGAAAEAAMKRGGAIGKAAYEKTKKPRYGAIGAAAAEAKKKAEEVKEIKEDTSMARKMSDEEATKYWEYIKGVPLTEPVSPFTPIVGSPEWMEQQVEKEKFDVSDKTITAPRLSADIDYSRVGTTATPEQLQAMPSWQETVKKFPETMTERHEEMALEKGHYIGRDEEGKPIHIQESPYQVKFGYSPHDPDFTSALSDIDANIREAESSLSGWQTNIDTAKQYLPDIEANYLAVKNAPRGATFTGDFDGDGVFDVDPMTGEPITKTKGELLLIFEKSLQDTRDAIATEKDMSSYEKNLRDMRNTRRILSGYQSLGYEMDVTDEGYSFEAPKASKVHEWYYGEAEPIQLTASAFMKTPLAVGTLFSGVSELITGDKTIGKSEREALAEYSLGLTSTLRKGDIKGYVMQTYVGSPAMIEGVYVPLATMGLGYGITGAGAGLSGVGGRFIAKVGGKIPTVFSVTGQKIISTGTRVVSMATKPFIATGKAVGRVMGTKAGEIMFTGGLYGIIEGPGLLETYREDPTRLPSEIGKSLFAWGMAIGGFKAGQKLYKTSHPLTESHWTKLPEEKGKFRLKTSQELLGYDADITVKKLPTGMKDFTKSEWWLKEKLYVTDIKSPVDITTRGPYDVSAYGKAVTTHKTAYTWIPTDKGLELRIVPKGTTFTYGKGMIRDPITGKLVVRSSSHTFKVMGQGYEIQVPGLVDPKGVIPHIFKARGVSQLMSTPDDITRAVGKGLFETGTPGQVTMTDYGRGGLKVIKVGKEISTGFFEIDFSKTISKVYVADTGKYIFGGKFEAKGFDVGKTFQFGKLSVIAEQQPLATFITKGIEKESLLLSQQAAVSLVRPVQPTTITEILTARKIATGVVGGISEAVGALPSVTTAPIPALTMMAKPGTVLPSVVTSVTRLDVEGEPLLIGKEPVFISKTKPVHPKKSHLIEMLGEVEVVREEEKAKKYVTGTLIGGRLKGEGELEGELDVGLTLVGPITEPGKREIEKEEEITGIRTDVDIGMDLWEGQQQKLGLKSLLELKSIQAMDLITITPTVVTPTPIVPVPPPPIIPIPLLSSDEPIVRKRKKKPKRREKPEREPRIAEGAFLADLISVTGTQARYRGKATHPALTEEMWKLGEKTGFVRMPTVELLEEKKGKRKKKKTPRLI